MDLYQTLDRLISVKVSQSLSNIADDIRKSAGKESAATPDNPHVAAAVVSLLLVANAISAECVRAAKETPGDK